MATATVAGFTAADITAASVAAGAGGRVLFPAGAYNATGLQNTVADQTWELERYAVLEKPASANADAILTNLAQGFRLRGGKIRDALTNTTPRGIKSEGYSLDVRDVQIEDVRGWGIVGGDAAMTLSEVTVRDSAHGGVFWNSVTTMRGPDIDRVSVYKSNPSKYASHGGIHVRTSGTLWTHWNQGTKITNCYVELPTGTQADNVGIDVWQGQSPLVENNKVYSGRICYSLYACQFHNLTKNFAFAGADYAYELADLSYGDASHNTARGWGVGLNYGFELNNHSVYNNIIYNRLIGFSGYGGQDYHASADSTPNNIVT